MVAIKAHDIQAVSKAVAVLARFGLDDRPASVAVADLRAQDVIRRHGLVSVICDALGPLATRPVTEFVLFDAKGEPMPIDGDGGEARMLDYLAQYDQHQLPARVYHTSSGRSYYM